MTLNPINPEHQFRKCPACGNTTPAQSVACAHCGAPSLEAAAAVHQVARETRFLRALFTRSNHFTMIFIGINVGVFALMCLAGGFVLMGADSEVLRGFGAKQNELIAGQHQYWRLITSIFIHIGFIHLLLNNYALWIIGQEIEQIYGSPRFVVLYLASGVLGSLASYIFSPQSTSAGASGAIFGLFGVMATFAFKYRKEIPALLSREIRRRVIPVIFINLAFGFSVSIIDNAAHIGGLLGGIALALAIPYMRPEEKRTPLVWRALQVVCLLMIFVSFVSAFRNYSGPPLAVSNVTRRPVSGVITYFDRMKAANERLGDVIKTSSASIKSRSQALDNQTRVVQPLIDSVTTQIAQINSAPRVDNQSEQYRIRLLDLLTEQKRILDELEKEGANNWDALAGEEEALRKKYNEFVIDYYKWLPGFLKEHGYELQK